MNRYELVSIKIMADVSPAVCEKRLKKTFSFPKKHTSLKYHFCKIVTSLPTGKDGPQKYRL